MKNSVLWKISIGSQAGSPVFCVKGNFHSNNSGQKVMPVMDLIASHCNKPFFKFLRAKNSEGKMATEPRAGKSRAKRNLLRAWTEVELSIHGSQRGGRAQCALRLQLQLAWSGRWECQDRGSAPHEANKDSSFFSDEFGSRKNTTAC